MSDAKQPQLGTSLTDREPRTERGRRTHRALLDAAAHEFGARGFHQTGINDITRRAGVALGSFYTWFESKEEIFRALVSDLSAKVKAEVSPHVRAAPDSIARERAALGSYLAYAADNKMIYRIIDEAEFVAPDTYAEHYRSTVARIVTRLQEGVDNAEMRPGIGEVEAWAIVGMNVFLGLRYGVWGDGEDLAEVTERANRLLAEGLGRRPA